MRNAFADHMIKLGQDKKNIFLTGDLGFMALEGVREAFGERFINCGVSEQNMIGVAAGLAKSDYCVFAYSIAPFIYARPFEQIRNDIACLVCQKELFLTSHSDSVCFPTSILKLIYMACAFNKGPQHVM